MAAAAIAAPIAAGISNSISGAANFDGSNAVNPKTIDFGPRFAGGLVGGVAAVAVRQAVYGGGKMNFSQVAADAFGNALGQALMSTGSASQLPRLGEAKTDAFVMTAGNSPITADVGSPYGDVSFGQPRSRTAMDDAILNLMTEQMQNPFTSAGSRIVLDDVVGSTYGLSSADEYGLNERSANLAAATDAQSRSRIGDAEIPVEAKKNAGLTTGLSILQEMSPREVFDARNSGTPIIGKSYTQTDYIEKLAGFNRSQFVNLKPSSIADNLDLVQSQVKSASENHGVSTDLTNAIIVIESKGMQNAVSPTGALGISQLTYGIYGSNGAIKSFGYAVNPFDPVQAIDRQAAFLSQLTSHYRGDLDKTAAAYNQGQPVVDSAIKKYGGDWRNFIPAEGRNYIIKVNEVLSGSRSIPGYFGTPRK